MQNSQLKDFIIDINECYKIKNKLKNKLWKEIKQLLKYSLVILGIIFICFIIFKIPQIDENILNLIAYINIFCIAGIFTLIHFVIRSIQKFNSKLYMQISALLLTNIQNLKLETIKNSARNILNLKISHNKLYIDGAFFNLAYRPTMRSDCYLNFNYHSKKVQIVNCKITTFLHKIPNILLFKGIIISINKNNLFNGNVCILQKNTFYFKRKPFANIPLVNIENPLLKKYNIYSDNHADLNKILEPNFLNAFLNLKKVFKGSVIDFGTNGNEIIIMIKTNNMPHKNLNLFTSINFNKLQEICEQQNAIINFINILK